MHHDPHSPHYPCHPVQRLAFICLTYIYVQKAQQSPDNDMCSSGLAGVYYNKVPYDKIHEIVAYHIQDFPEDSQRPPTPGLGKKVSPQMMAPHVA